jgi:two-component system chemotaxis response regulator CheY
MSLVLVIDDDPAVCLVMRHLLERHGFEVSTASDGQSGLSRFAELNPDLVIVDILMPGKEGMATILEMREAQPEARILAMTGGGSFAANEVLRIAELIGADNSLSKPFAPAELISTVERCLAA